MSEMATRRAPEDVEVYELGHYEQQQIEFAIQETIENSDPNNLDEANSAVTLRSLQGIFASHGTITIIRRPA